MRKNSVKYIINSVLHATALLFATGTIVQTFLLAMGVDAEKVSLYASWVQLIQVTAMFLCVFFGDAVKNIKNAMIGILIVLPVLFLSMLAVLLF